jgi:outer membrane protein
MVTENSNQLQEESVVPAEKKAEKKINYTTIINLVLFIGLLVLYALYFAGIKGSSTSQEQEEQISELAEKLDAGQSNIAYINSERLMEEYDLAKKMREDFAEEQTRMENDLARRQRSFQAEVEKFQRDIQAGSISMEMAQAKEQSLLEQREELFQLNETFSNRLMQKEMEMNAELLEMISEFLARYNTAHGFDFILGYSRGGGILFANEQHDITNDVLTKLNAEYLATPR